MSTETIERRPGLDVVQEWASRHGFQAEVTPKESPRGWTLVTITVRDAEGRHLSTTHITEEILDDLPVLAAYLEKRVMSFIEAARA